MDKIRNRLLGLCGKYAISSGKASLFGDKIKAKKELLKLAATMRLLKIINPHGYP